MDIFSYCPRVTLRVTLAISLKKKNVFEYVISFFIYLLGHSLFAMNQRRLCLE